VSADAMADAVLSLAFVLSVVTLTVDLLVFAIARFADS